MSIIKKSIGLSKTIKNVGRLKEIVTIFAKHGFSEFISIGVTNIIPNFALPSSKVKLKEELNKSSKQDWPTLIGQRLRLCFEELGPTFIKLGQILSSREDIFDAGFINEMKVLRDNVKGVDFSEIKKIISKEIPNSEEIFESIDENAIGTASIGVVYKAKLKAGEEVVLKVRRPHIEKVIENDVSILFFLAQQFEKIGPEVKFLGVSRIINDFSLAIHNELNFNIEALNCERLKKNLKVHDTENIFYLPKIYKEYSSEKIIVMELIKGTPFTDTEKIGPHIAELKPKLEKSIEQFLKTFLNDGFFHADLHGGNFFYMPNGQIALIDFGLMGTLGKKNRLSFIAIIYALITYNYENLIYEFLDVADYDNTPDVDALVTDVKQALSPYVGLTVSQTNFSLVLKSVVRTLSEHEVFLPREWFVVFRALITLDGVGRSIGIDFDIFTLLEKDIKDIVKDSFNKEELIEEGIWAARDMISSYRIFPRHLKWFLKDISRKNYQMTFKIKDLKKSFANIANSIQFLAYSVMLSTFLYIGSDKLESLDAGSLASMPTKNLLFLLFALITFLTMVFQRRE